MNEARCSLSSNPRYIAFMIVDQFICRKISFKQIASEIIEKYVLSELDRRFIYQIAKGTVRFLLKIDFAVSFFSGLKISKINTSVLNILRVAIYQLLYMDRVPKYAAVNESVAITKEISGINSARFVNAVLRKISSRDKPMEIIEDTIIRNYKSFEKRLSLQNSFPAWIIKEWCSMYKKSTIEEICTNLNREPFLYARVNRLKSNKNKFASLFSDYQGIREFRDFPSMIKEKYFKELFSDTFCLESSQDIRKVPGFSEGFFSIQDFSSQIAVRYLLDPHKGDKILDLCGAPGGKASYASEITNNGCEIYSVDINSKKLDMFSENIERLGLENINLIEADATENGFLGYKNKRSSFFYGYFDKIFIDAPCSALGTIAKNPDVKYLKEYEDLKNLAETSGKILMNSLKYLKQNGKIIFYTCTLSRIENQYMINSFIRSNKNDYTFESLENILRILYKEPQDVSTLKVPKKHFLEIMPFYFNSEGGFACILRKTR